MIRILPDAPATSRVSIAPPGAQKIKRATFVPHAVRGHETGRTIARVPAMASHPAAWLENRFAVWKQEKRDCFEFRNKQKGTI